MAGKPEPDEQLLSIGQQCADPHCLLVDFLPFKCQHCVQSFCGEHFKVEAHNCSKYDESKHNRVAPSCPLCNQPVAIPLNQDPNIRMEHHINTECSVMTGRRQTKSAPVCARGKCGKVLFAPISCKNCNRQFCPQHRFPGDHNCGSTASISTSKPASQQIADFSSKASAASSATLEAVRRKWAATPIPSTSLANPSSTKIDRSFPPASPSTPHTNVLITAPTSNPPSPTANSTTTPTTNPPPAIDFTSFVPRPIFASA